MRPIDIALLTLFSLLTGLAVSSRIDNGAIVFMALGWLMLFADAIIRGFKP